MKYHLSHCRLGKGLADIYVKEHRATAESSGVSREQRPAGCGLWTVSEHFCIADGGVVVGGGTFQSPGVEYYRVSSVEIYGNAQLTIQSISCTSGAAVM